MYIFVYASYIVLMFVSPFSSGAARFTQYPKEKLYAVKGKTATFTWDYSVDNIDTELDSESPIWYFHNKSIIIGYADAFNPIKRKIVINELTCPERLRIPTLRVSFEGKGTLRITNVTLADSGMYACRLVLSSGHSESMPTKESQLVVTETPTFTSKPNATTIVVEHNNLAISCSAVGTPTPNVTWWNISSSSMSVVSKGLGSADLTIPTITRHYDGQRYECRASNNPNENPISTNFTVLQINYSPEITSLPTNITVIQGDTITLKCEAKSNPSINSVYWERENGYMGTGSTLTIPRANEFNAGKYTCTVSNFYDGSIHTAKGHAYVLVKYQPTIVYNSREHTVNESDSVTLMCKAKGVPVPNITWTKSPGTIKSLYTGENYTILHVKKSDNGTYTCTANNGIGSAATASIRVAVQYKPKIDLKSSDTTVGSWAGNSMELKCKWLEAYPNPTWTWYNPRDQQISTSNVNAIDKSSKVKVTTGSNSSDYGIYRCKASNDAGSAYHNISVTRLYPPGRPNVTVTNVDASSAVVHWTKPKYIGGSQITGYNLEVNGKPYDLTAETLERTLSQLDNDNTYNVKIRAKNVAGYGEFSTTTFKTKKEGKPALPVVTIVEVQETSVKLRWSKPAENGAPITNYTIYQKEDGHDMDWKPVSRIYGQMNLEISISDLKPGTTYYFIVTASNKFGESPIGDGNKKRTVVIPFQTTTLPTDNVGPSKGRSSGEGSDPNQTIIIVGVVVAVVLILITAIISVIILKKKKVFGKRKVPSSNRSAAYHNDVDSSDSAGRGAAVVTLNDDGAPTYAAVDMTKKTKKKDEIPNYAAVDKSKKKKKPGEIIYAELADFNTNHVPAGPRPAQYTETDYADISQFQNQVEPEPTYANFPGRSKDYNI